MKLFDKIETVFRHPQYVPLYLLDRLIYQLDSRQMNVYERDWDLLLILDACRVDSLQEIAPEYDFLPKNISHITSVAGGSPTWLANTFTSDWQTEIQNTAYISANPHTRRVLGESMEGLYAEIGGESNQLEHFEYFKAVWESNWDDDIGTVPARAVTDNIINYCRYQSSDRVIGHYMQPHFPSVPSPIGEGLDLDDDAQWHYGGIWSLIRSGRVTVDEAYRAYLENLRYVMNDVELVLSNVDADKVVISADHGNAFGEWRTYSHGLDFVKVVRNVPWIEISASDSKSYDPNTDSDAHQQSSDKSLNEKLRALGYR